jgi:hypothetical protein
LDRNDSIDITISPEKDMKIMRRSSEVLNHDDTNELDKAQFLPFIPNEDEQAEEVNEFSVVD